MPDRQSPWVYDIRVPGLVRRDMTRIIKALNEDGIAARHGFLPMTWQKEFRIEGVVDPATLNWNAAKAGNEVFYLPLGKEVDDKECERAFKIIHSILHHGAVVSAS